MTGEITLHGQVLKIGGLKEKLLAAKRAGIQRVIIPFDNKDELKEIPKKITHALNIIPVKWVDEVISEALISEPVPLKSKKIRSATPRTLKNPPRGQKPKTH
jgi:ATP-dependent Lon protease